MPVVVTSPPSIPFANMATSHPTHHQHQHQHQHQLQHHQLQPSSLLSTPVSPSVYSPVTPAATSKWRVTPNQREILQSAFDINPYPELRCKEDLAVKLGVTTTQVSKWFQHRRETLTRLGRFKAQYNRTRRTPAQLDVLQQSFEIDRYPSAERLAQLEAQLDGVTAKQIKLWFKHRRKQVHKRNRASTSNSTSPTARSNPHSPFPVDSSLPQHHLAQSFPPTPTVHNHFIHPTSSPTSVSFPLQSHSLAQQPHSMPNATVLPQSSLQQQHQPPPPPPPPDTPPNYSLDPSSYYAFKRHSHLTNSVLPTSSRPAFSDAEIMALRAASVVTDGKPSPDALTRLARVLNRSHIDVSYWFSTLASAADSIGMADGHMTDAMSHPSFVGSPCLTQSDAPPLYANSAAPAQDVSNSQPQLHMQTQTHVQDHMQGISLGFPRQDNANASSSTNEPLSHHQGKDKHVSASLPHTTILGGKRVDDGLPNGSEQQQGGNNVDDDNNNNCNNSNHNNNNNNNDGVVVIESVVGPSVGKNDTSEAEMNSVSLVHHGDNSSQPQSQLHHPHQEDAQGHRQTQDQSHGQSDSQIIHPQSQPQHLTERHHEQQQQQQQQHAQPQPQQPQPPPPTSLPPQQQQHLQHLQHHTQPQAQGMHGMYGTIVYPDGGMMMAAHPVGIPMEGQNSPTLAPLRHVAGSPIPSGYVTSNNVWYSQGPTYK